MANAQASVHVAKSKLPASAIVGYRNSRIPISLTINFRFQHLAACALVFENEAYNKTLNLFVNRNALFETRSLVLRTVVEASIFGRSIKFYSLSVRLAQILGEFDYVRLPNPIEINRTIGVRLECDRVRLTTPGKHDGFA